MKIFHISGMPGSGKSTLGERIQLIEEKNAMADKIRVIDTDDLIRKDCPDGKELLDLEKMSLEDGYSEAIYEKVWRNIFKTNIEKKIDEAKKKEVKLLVFVGILDHFGHSNSCVVFPGEAIKYFLDPEPAILLCQFYSRYGKIFPSKDEFWSDLVLGKEEIPSSPQYLKMREETRKWHHENGYIFLSQSAIFSLIDHYAKSIR